MKILHCCLAAFYIDKYGYQENILPKHHKLQGHDVRIVASTETYLDNQRIGYVKPSRYVNEDGIRVARLSYVNWLPKLIARKLRIYVGLVSELENFSPDIIFLHDVQFLSIVSIADYMKKNKHVRLYADGHTDFINSARSWVSREILHKIIYRWCAKHIEPYTTCFFGVTPLRVKFFEEVYLIDKNKLDLLVLGVDDSVFNLNDAAAIRTRLRNDLGINDNDFVVVTGGKIDRRKNIHILMQVIADFDNENIKLIVFGFPVDDLKSEFDMLASGDKIIAAGWVAPEKVYDYFFAADIGCFPGTHSVLWEQAVGVGLPCVFRKWNGIEHVDVGGNCLMVDEGNYQEIHEAILKIYTDKELLACMRRVAMNKGVPNFAYSKIAKKAIGQQ